MQGNYLTNHSKPQTKIVVFALLLCAFANQTTLSFFKESVTTESFIDSKGIGTELKALSGLPVATAFLQNANELKQTIGKLPVPTNASVKVVTDTLGNKMVFPDVELTKLKDIVKMMKSSDDGLTVLKNGSTAGTKAIKEVAGFEKISDGYIEYSQILQSKYSEPDFQTIWELLKTLL